MVREKDVRGRGRLVLVLALVAVFAVGVGFAVPMFSSGDRIDALTSEAEGGGSFELVRRYVPGSRETWDMRIRMEMGGGGAGGDACGEAQVEMLVAGTLTEEVLAVDSEGGAEVRLTLEAARPTGRAILNGQETPLDGLSGRFDPGGRSIRLRLDARGEVVENLEAGDETGAGLEDFLPGRLVSVPSRALSPGDEWRARTALPMEDLPLGAEMTLELDLRFRVEGYARRAGRTCAVVSVRGKVDSGGREAISVGPLELSVGAELKGVHLQDVETGILVMSAVDVALHGAVSGPDGSAEFDARMEMDLEIR
jgi:hypothetical protein